MDTGTFSLRRIFRNGSCKDWPLAILLLLIVIVVPSASARRRVLGADKPVLVSKPKQTRRQHTTGRRRSGAVGTTDMCLYSCRYAAWRARIKGVQTFRIIVPADPGVLTLGKTGRRDLRFPAGLGERRFTAQVAHQLPIADRAQGGGIGGEP